MKYMKQLIFPLAVTFLTKNHKHFANAFLRIFKKILESFQISQIFVWVFLYFGVKYLILILLVNYLENKSISMQNSEPTVLLVLPRFSLVIVPRSPAFSPITSVLSKISVTATTKGLILLPQNLATLQTNLDELGTKICGDCVETKGLFSCYHCLLLPSYCFFHGHIYFFEASSGL